MFHEMCYTLGRMQSDSLIGTRSSWVKWAGFLRRNQLEHLAAWALEALGPLNIVVAQTLHAGSIFLRPALSAEGTVLLASLLEDPAESRFFAAYLREEV